jgi:hypothetical protein
MAYGVSYGRRMAPLMALICSTNFYLFDTYCTYYTVQEALVQLFVIYLPDADFRNASMTSKLGVFISFIHHEIMREERPFIIKSIIIILIIQLLLIEKKTIDRPSPTIIVSKYTIDIVTSTDDTAQRIHPELRSFLQVTT